MKHIENMATVASNIEVWQLVLAVMDKYQRAFEAMGESEPTSDLPDPFSNCPE